METNTNDKIEIKDKLIYLFNKDKMKFYILILFLIILSISSIFIKNYIEKKNQITADNYIKAGLYLASGKKEESLNIFDEIIKSGNKFYSILALSKILEKNLISDQKIILDYFLVIEKNEQAIFDMASTGFASTVRLAKSAADTWTPIFLENKTNIIKSLDEYIKNLKEFKSFIETNDNKMLDKTMNSTNYIKTVLDGIKPNKNE